NSGSGGSGSGGTSDPVGTVISNIQTPSGNWRSWGQGAPTFVDCNPSPCHGYEWSHKFNVTNPSLSNNATAFSLGGPNGTTPYGDVLFSAGLIGQNSSQLQDRSHTLLPTLKNFIYDTDFYVTNASITQSLEFDITLNAGGVGITWGTQCNYLGDKNWDTWDNATQHWVSTGFPCKFVNGWNHVTIRLQRKTDNTVVYQSIELNGTTYALNRTSAPTTVPGNWWGLDANYQMDGNYKETPNTTYLDNMSVTYW
ncbi:MAG: hypothetical protein ABI142_10895, partial [Bryocella sp.]